MRGDAHPNPSFVVFFVCVPCPCSKRTDGPFRRHKGRFCLPTRSQSGRFFDAARCIASAWTAAFSHAQGRAHAGLSIARHGVWSESRVVDVPEPSWDYIFCAGCAQARWAVVRHVGRCRGELGANTVWLVREDCWIASNLDAKSWIAGARRKG